MACGLFNRAGKIFIPTNVTKKRQAFTTTMEEQVTIFKVFPSTHTLLRKDVVQIQKEHPGNFGILSTADVAALSSPNVTAVTFVPQVGILIINVAILIGHRVSRLLIMLC